MHLEGVEDWDSAHHAVEASLLKLATGIRAQNDFEVQDVSAGEELIVGAAAD